MEIPLEMEPFRIIRQHKGRARLLVGLEYCDVKGLFLGLELDWGEGPLLKVPAKNWGESRHPPAHPTTSGTKEARPDSGLWHPILSSSLLCAVFSSLEARNCTILPFQ